MNYMELSKSELIKIINDYQLLTRQLLAEVGPDPSFDGLSTGNMGNWYLNMQDDMMVGSSRKLKTLGFSENEILQGISTRQFLSKIHSEDIQKIVDDLHALRNGHIIEYVAEYRVKDTKNKDRRFQDRARITQYDSTGRPLLLSGFTKEIFLSDDKEEEEQNTMLDHQLPALTDNLTETKNRRSLIMELSKAVFTAEQKKSPLAVALLNIDDFNIVNETEGHLCGNRVLIEMTELIQKAIHENGIFGRYRTNEFMIIFSRTNREQASQILEQIRADVENGIFSDKVKLTISGGVNEYQGEDPCKFLNAVEEKLSQAKYCGKNIIVS